MIGIHLGTRLLQLRETEMRKKNILIFLETVKVLDKFKKIIWFKALILTQFL